MRITISTDEGHVFAIHDVGEEMAEHLKYRLWDAIPDFGKDRPQEPDHAPGDCDAEEFLQDLDTALRMTINGRFEEAAGPAE